MAIVEGKLKIIILVLVVLLATSLFLIFSIQSSKSALLREYNYTRQKLTQANKELTNKLSSILAENSSLQDRLRVIQEDLERASAERSQVQTRFELINKERAELLEKLKLYAQLQKDLELFKNENRALKEQIDVLEKNKFKLKSDLNGLRRDNEILKQKIEEAQRSLEEKTLMAGYGKEQEVDLTQESELWSVDLPPIVISPQLLADIDLPSSLEGGIINVNREYNFVVIDLGQGMGVREGMVFEVFRKGKFLGKVEVIQLREKIAACDIIQANIPFRVGDIVRY